MSFVGIQDVFTESGPYQQLLKKYGLDAEGVERGILSALAKKH